MSTMDKAAATALRKPFPAESVGKLPKPYKADSAKGNCPECHGYHGLPAAHLDFVGHAAVTDRLLTVDPHWSWEPMAYDQYGSPMRDQEGNLWIKLTICGVTRLGVGDGKSMKERIGDAVRNGAMRFGVGLDLWAKENLVEFAQAAHAAQPEPPRDVTPAATPEQDDDDLLNQLEARVGKATRAQVQKVVVMMDKRGIKDRDAVLAYVSGAVGRPVTTRTELTAREAHDLIDLLAQIPESVTA